MAFQVEAEANEDAMIERDIQVITSRKSTTNLASNAQQHHNDNDGHAVEVSQDTTIKLKTQVTKVNRKYEVVNTIAQLLHQRPRRFPFFVKRQSYYKTTNHARTRIHFDDHRTTNQKGEHEEKLRVSKVLLVPIPLVEPSSYKLVHINDHQSNKNCQENVSKEPIVVKRNDEAKKYQAG